MEEEKVETKAVKKKESNTIKSFKAKADCNIQLNDLRLQIYEGKTYENVDKFWLRYLKAYKVI